MEEEKGYTIEELNAMIDECELRYVDKDTANSKKEEVKNIIQKLASGNKTFRYTIMSEDPEYMDSGSTLSFQFNVGEISLVKLGNGRFIPRNRGYIRHGNNERRDFSFRDISILEFMLQNEYEECDIIEAKDERDDGEER